jgi:hypothetical protein
MNVSHMFVSMWPQIMDKGVELAFSAPLESRVNGQSPDEDVDGLDALLRAEHGCRA